MKYNVQGIILKNSALSRDIYLMELSLGRLGSLLKPGQFLHVRIGTGIDPLLRRPFSVYRVCRRAKEVTVQVLYRVVGKGTALLAQKKAGERLDVLGPLGNGFDVSRVRRNNTPIIMVAGGIGIAPLVYLAESLRQKKAGSRAPRVDVYLGTDTADNLVSVSLLKKMGCRVRVATDDGTTGFHGYVTDLMRRDLAVLRRATPPYIIACGPLAMLHAVQDICRVERWPGQVSVDEMMGCGVGACLGCVIRTVARDGAIRYQRICHDGPVFDMLTIAREESL